MNDRGSVLMLMPAAVLIVLLLGAISIDAALSFQAQREAIADAQSIAHDVVSAVSVAALREGADPRTAPLDGAEVRRRVDATVRARHLSGNVQWEINGGVVTVRVTKSVRLVFRGVMPGASRTTQVRGRATAVLVPQMTLAP